MFRHILTTILHKLAQVLSEIFVSLDVVCLYITCDIAEIMLKVALKYHKPKSNPLIRIITTQRPLNPGYKRRKLNKFTSPESSTDMLQYLLCSINMLCLFRFSQAKVTATKGTISCGPKFHICIGFSEENMAFKKLLWIRKYKWHESSF
jgi:hypothetical protein